MSQPVNKNTINNIKNTIIDQVKDNLYGIERNRIILVVVTKDNEDTIEGVLEMANDLVDAMYVFDNGSKDDTAKLVKQYFSEMKIPTKYVPSDKSSVDNGLTKKNAFLETVKLCKAQKWSLNKTYCLFLNPDEEIYFPENYNKEELTHDSYILSIRDGTYITYQSKLFKMDKNWMCKGRVNEYWAAKNTTSARLPEEDFNIIYVNDIDDDDYNNLLLENIKIMEEDLAKNPDDTHSLFYTAEHYFELEDYEKALPLYNKRLETIYNNEQEYISKLRIAECKVELVYDEEEIKSTYLQLINEYPFMLEPVFNLMYFYYVIKDWKSAYEIGVMGANILKDDIPYKYEHKIYDYKFKQKMLKICVNYEKYGLGVKLGLDLLKDRLFDREDKEEIKDQYKKCLRKLTNKDLGLNDETLERKDIKILLLSENEDEKTVKLYKQILSYGSPVEIISNKNLENHDSSKGWANLTNDKVSLLDVATKYAFDNRFKYTWFINSDVEFGDELKFEDENSLKKMVHIDRIDKLLFSFLGDDLITTELSEDNEDMQKLLDENIMNTISKDVGDWMSTSNNICRMSYKLLGKINEYRIKNKKLINHEFLLPTLCNKHQEMNIIYISELDEQPIRVYKRNNLELSEKEKNVLANPNTYYFNISIYTPHESEVTPIKEYYTLDVNEVEITDSNDMVTDVKINTSIKYPTYILLENDIELTNADTKLVKGLERKNIIFHRTDSNEKYSLRYSSENYICMSTVLRDILENFADSTERLQFLGNLLEGEEIVILSGGPSTGMLTDKELKHIYNNYITITVKYALDVLLKNDLYPTFNVFNQYVASGSLDDLIENGKQFTSLFGSDGSFEDDTSLMMVEVNDEHYCIRNFKKLLMNHVDCLTWKEDTKHKRSYINLHIMCEMALPLAIHLGIKKIYTTGWDLKSMNNQDYCYKSNLNLYQNSKISEYNYVPDIEKILNNMGISINKIKESPVLLKLVDFFPKYKSIEV